MAHTDPFIFLPIVVWIFISFWFIYVLTTAHFFPRIYKAFRARTLMFTYLSVNFYKQIWGIMGFLVVFSKLTINFCALLTNLARVSVSLLSLRTSLLFTKLNFMNKVLKRHLNYIT